MSDVAEPSRRPSVVVLADDPLMRDGTAAYLTLSEQIDVLPDTDMVRADVVVVAVDTVTGETMSRLSDVSERTDGTARVVLVTDEVSEDQLVLAVAYGVVSVLRKSATTHAQITRTVVDGYHGRCVLPAAFVGRLASLLRELHRSDKPPRGMYAAGLTPREIELLRLLAEGLDTAEIADKLGYSERSIKTFVHDVTKRLGLRNRTHAVAHAMRAGLI
ncbi:LuxR C-terminal-related transcriptional regulator [Streptomyces olivaceoviridis]